MNRRGVPGRSRQTTVKTKEISSQKGIAVAHETISRLTRELQVLQKKVALLQKVDLNLLTDDAEDGDVTFFVNNDRVIKVHRFILASKSPIFKKMFDNNMREKFSGEICVEDISAPVLRTLIKFLYTAELKFTDEATATELFKVAHKYDIPELQAECETELNSSVCEENLSEMMRISHMYGVKGLMEKCVHILRNNFDRVHEKLLTDLLT